MRLSALHSSQTDRDRAHLHQAHKASVRAQLRSSAKYAIKRTPRQPVALAPSHL
jgi:hypothetical protein